MRKHILDTPYEGSWHDTLPEFENTLRDKAKLDKGKPVHVLIRRGAVVIGEFKRPFLVGAG